MYRRLLLANRGEVAVRVLRTCRALGIQAVAVASPADRDLRWLQEADEVVELPDNRAYLDQDALIDAATRTACSHDYPRFWCSWGKRFKIVFVFFTIKKSKFTFPYII